MTSPASHRQKRPQVTRAWLAVAAIALAVVLELAWRRYEDRAAAMRSALDANRACGAFVPDAEVRRAVEEFHGDGFSWAKAAKTEATIVCPIRAP